MSRIGVVTVTYNSAPVLAEFLESVRRQTHGDYILYIVDSGSSDGTQELLGNINDPHIRCILRSENIGFAAGTNLGIKAALEEGCESVMLVNNDTVLGPELFEQLLDGLERYNCDMTTPKMLYYDAPDKVWAAGGQLNKWLGYRQRHDDANQLDDGKRDRPRRVTFTPFCCVLMKGSVFRRIGYLDEAYFVYVEDVDYCYRALKAGISMRYLPGCRLWHKVSSLTGGGQSLFAMRYCTRNRVYFLCKNIARPLAAGWAGAYWLYLWARRVARKDTKEIWQLKRGAFIEGLRLYASSRAYREGSRPVRGWRRGC